MKPIVVADLFPQLIDDQCMIGGLELATRRLTDHDLADIVSIRSQTTK